MPLNKNNFLRWTGSILPCDFTLYYGGAFTAILYANEESVTAELFGSSWGGVSTIGIDFTSLNITGTEGIELASPPQWNYETGILTTFRPTDNTVTVYDVNFTVNDLLGNQCTGVCAVLVSAIYTTWVVYTPTQVCVLDNFGNNTGYSNYEQLILVNQSTSSPIVPMQLSPNIPSNPNYIAPLQDLVTCPTYGSGGLTAPLIISNNTANNSDGNFITITLITLYSSTLGVPLGSAPLTLVTACNIPPGKSLRLNIPATSGSDVYNTVTLNYTVTGNMDTAAILRYWLQSNLGVVTGFGNGGSGLQDNLVDNSGVLSFSGTFNLPNPAGAVIFAQ